MIDAQTPLSRLPTETVQTGTVLLQRSVANDSVIFVDKGRVALGVVGTGADRATVERAAVSLLRAPALDPLRLLAPHGVDAMALPNQSV